MQGRLSLKLAASALVLAARQALSPSRNLPITKLGPLFSALPAEFRITVADVGSIGGLHRRWNKLAPHLVTMNFDPLDNRQESNRQRIFPVLLGAEEGQSTLRVTRRPSMSSTLDPNQPFFAPFWHKPEHVEIVETIEAPMTTLDKLAAAHSLWPDAIKIDVQGGEGGVLAGAREVLGRSVLLAEIECSFAERYREQQTFDQIVASMRSQGFALLDVWRLKRYRYRNQLGIENPSLGRGMRAGRLAFCDAIFMLEPERLWQRISDAGEAGGQLWLKAFVLALVYGKPDLAAAIFDHVRKDLPNELERTIVGFLNPLRGGGGRTQQLHQVFDAWSRRV